MLSVFQPRSANSQSQNHVRWSKGFALIVDNFGTDFVTVAIPVVSSSFQQFLIFLACGEDQAIVEGQARDRAGELLLCSTILTVT